MITDDVLSSSIFLESPNKLFSLEEYQKIKNEINTAANDKIILTLELKTNKSLAKKFVFLNNLTKNLFYYKIDEDDKSIKFSLVGSKKEILQDLEKYKYVIVNTRG